MGRLLNLRYSSPVFVWYVYYVSMCGRSRLDVVSNWNGAGDCKQPLFETCDGKVKWRTRQCKLLCRALCT